MKRILPHLEKNNDKKKVQKQTYPRECELRQEFFDLAKDRNKKEKLQCYPELITLIQSSQYNQ